MCVCMSQVEIPGKWKKWLKTNKDCPPSDRSLINAKVIYLTRQQDGLWLDARVFEWVDGQHIEGLEMGDGHPHHSLSTRSLCNVHCRWTQMGAVHREGPEERLSH